MAQQSKDTVKQWFETGDYPTQQQFYDLFDSILWKNEAGINHIAGLIVALQNKVDRSAFEAFMLGERIAFNGSGYYDIPEGYLLEKIIVLPGVDANVQMGSFEYGDDLLPPIPVSEAHGDVQVLNLYAKVTRRIYFSGLPANSAIIFFKRKVKTA